MGDPMPEIDDAFRRWNEEAKKTTEALQAFGAALERVRQDLFLDYLEAGAPFGDTERGFDLWLQGAMDDA